MAFLWIYGCYVLFYLSVCSSMSPKVEHQRVFDPQLFTNIQKQAILDRIILKTERAGQCLLWKNARNNKMYPHMTIQYPGSGSRLMTVHRLVYSLTSGKPVGLANERGFHVSHLCHHPLCVDFTHLSYEPGAVNLQRRTCKQLGQCKEHRPYPPCILN